MVQPAPLTTPAADRRIRREAHSAAVRARALAMRRSGATYRAIGTALGGLSLERARHIVSEAERRINSPHWADALPTRAVSFLRRAGFLHLTEAEAAAAVAQLSRSDLMGHRNVGRGAVAALTAWLAGFTASETTGPCVEAREPQAAAVGEASM